MKWHVTLKLIYILLYRVTSVEQYISYSPDTITFLRIHHVGKGMTHGLVYDLTFPLPQVK